MTLHFDAAQLSVGLALIDSRFERALLRNRGRALRTAALAVEAAPGVALTDEDRLWLGSIRAGTLQEFAQGVERLCGPVRAAPAAEQGAPAFAGASETLAVAVR